MGAANGRAGYPGYRCQAKMRSRCEGAANDFCKESGCGPDTDSKHADQDRVKRVSKNPLFYFFKRNFISLFTQCDELESQAWQNNDSSIGTGDEDSFPGQCLSDVYSKALYQTRSELAELGISGSGDHDTIAGLSCLCGKIIIEAAEHGEFGD